MRSYVAAFAAAAVIVTAHHLPGQLASPADSALMRAAFSRVPICFIENRDVYPEDVRYYLQGADKTLFFTNSGITFRLNGEDRGWVVKLEFVGASPGVVAQGDDLQKGVFSYFCGPEAEWKTGLRTFGRIVYRDVWPGIDVVYRGEVGQLKYDFIVKPGADPDRIRFRFLGATDVHHSEHGSLVVKTPVRSFEDAPPNAYQELGGERVEVDVAYRLKGERSSGTKVFGFRVGNYDGSKALVLDPAVLVYCGYLGGAKGAHASSIAVDAAGNSYVTGWTTSPQTTFPVKVGPDLTFNGGGGSGNHDGFIAKVNAQGTALIYCGYIGGSSIDMPAGVAVDSKGSAYVTGRTMSSEATFPAKVGPDVTINGLLDAFVAKVNPAGTGLDYCGYIGGSGSDSGEAIAVDTQGAALVGGATGSSQTSFPVAVGPDLFFNGAEDGFVAKVTSTGKGLAYCGYIGGSGIDRVHAVAVDTAGAAYVVGMTTSNEITFPAIVGPDLKQNGGIDAFVAKVKPAGKVLVYAGFVGGNSTDYGYDVGVDSQGCAYVVGSTAGGLPVKVGPDLIYNGGSSDGFVAKVSAQGTTFSYLGYVGGSAVDDAFSVAVNGQGTAIVVGTTHSTESTFPVSLGPDLSHNGKADAFVAQVNPTGKVLDYSGFIGGNAVDGCWAVATDPAGCAYVAGSTSSDEKSFPVRIGPDLTYNCQTTQGDVFVAKVSVAHVMGSGSTRLGGRVNLGLIATGDPGLPYQAGSSFGTGPIQLDTRTLRLTPDALLAISVNGGWPSTFVNYRGALDARGRAAAQVAIPTSLALVGLRIHTSFVTLDAKAPSGVRSVASGFSFTVSR